MAYLRNNNRKFYSYNNKHLIWNSLPDPIYYPPDNYLYHFPLKTDLDNDSNTLSLTNSDTINFVSSPWGGAVDLIDLGTIIYNDSLNIFQNEYFTISFWINYADLEAEINEDSYFLSSHGSDYNNNAYIMLTRRVDLFQFRKCNDDGCDGETFDYETDENVWHHITIKGDQSDDENNNYSFYLDGIKYLDKIVPRYYNDPDMKSGFQLGGSNWNGLFSDLYLYNRLLTDEEVYQLFKMHKNDI